MDGLAVTPDIPTVLIFFQEVRMKGVNVGLLFCKRVVGWA
jgi:hypothetical protein